MIHLKLFILSLPIFFLIDMLWLGLIAKDFYKGQIGILMKVDINWYAAILFYTIFIAGLVFFAIEPAVQKNSLKHAVLLGGTFGLVTYATYDLTNLATLKNWPILLSIIDIGWGILLGMLVSGITFLLFTSF